MKKSNKFLGLLALILLVFPVFVLAAEFRASQQPSFASTEKVTNNLYIAGGAVVSAGSADKDLLIAGGTVLVSGPVGGDLFVVGGNLTVLSQVTGDLRIGGGNVVVSGNVLGDVVLGGGQVILSSKIISGDVAVAGGAVRLDSEVKGNVKIAGGEIYLNAPIGGNVDIKADKLTLGPNADIKGNLKYGATKLAVIEEGARVRGETTFNEFKVRDGLKKNIAVGMFGFLTFVFISKFLMLLTTALIFGLVFRKYSAELMEKATSDPLKEFGRGIVTFIVLPVLSIFLLVTVIGVPFGILGLLSFIMLFIFGAILTPIFLGALVYKWISRQAGYVINWKTILLGVIVYSILGWVPFVGWIAKCVAVSITIGAALNIKWQVVKSWR